MDLVVAKRQKMSKMSELTQTSSETQKIGKPETGVSLYIEHYDSPYYVDKTLLLEKLIDDDHILVTAPSRFGKSLNMNMARTFFEIELDKKNNPIVLEVNEDNNLLKDVQPASKNFELFKDKKIFENKEFMSEHFGKYPVIFANFRPVNGDNFEQILFSLRNVIHKAFTGHRYLKDCSIWKSPKFSKENFMNYYDTEKKDSLTLDQIKNGLRTLAEYLYHYYSKKVFVFIDEFDVPVSSMIYKDRMTPDDKKSTIKLIQEIMGILLNGTDKYVTKSLFTGCQQLGGILLHGANNIQHNPFMKPHDISEFYGFSDIEIEKMLKRVGKYYDFEKIQKHYNGYRTKLEDGRVISICSPWSVIQYLITKQLSNNWSAGIVYKIRNAMTCIEIRPKIMKILYGEHLQIQYKEKLQITDIDALHSILNTGEIDSTHIDLFMQFLYEYGFFYPIEFGKNHLILALPNEAVHAEIDNILSSCDAIKKYYNHKKELINDYITSLVSLAALCEKSRVYKLAKSIESLYEKAIRKPLNKFDFHAALHGYIAQKFIKVCGECRTIENPKCDTVVVIEKHNAVFVIEVTFKKSAEMAYEQLVDRKHYTLADDSSLAKLFPPKKLTIDNRIYLGINMDENCKVTIRYSFNGVESPETVCSGDI